MSGDGASGPQTTRGPDTAASGGVGYAWTPTALATVRSRRRWRWSLLAVAMLVGLGLAWLHWLGLVVGGALVGVVSRTVPRAVAVGLAFGGFVLAVHVLASPAMGAGEFLGFAPLSSVTLAAALVGPTWGALLRAVV